jgi:hypothetical protein
MATVRDFEIDDALSARPQDDVEARVRLVDCAGERFVQIDTFGRPDRVHKGKTSQTLRLSEGAFRKLIEVGIKHF